MKMFGPDFVWILSPKAGVVDDWVKVAEIEKTRAKITDQKHRTCTKEQFEMVVNRSFILVENDLREDVNTSTDSGLVRKYREDAPPPLPPCPPRPTPFRKRRDDFVDASETNGPLKVVSSQSLLMVALQVHLRE